jgi:phosphatidate cytidylyltransferase
LPAVMAACSLMILGSAITDGTRFGPVLTVGVLGIAVYSIARAAPSSASVVWVLTAVGSVLYVGVPLAVLVLRRAGAEGFALIAWTVLVIALADIAAMFGGLLFGRTQIVPRISEGKTLEGTLAGIAGALVGAALFGNAD